MTEAQKRAWIKNGLRRMSYRWPGRYNSLKAARIERGIYECKKCKKRHKVKEGRMDHIRPIVPVTGWDDWDGLITRLFVDEKGWQRLCKECHHEKSQKENKRRKKAKANSR